MQSNPLVPAVLAYFALVGLFYILGAIFLSIWKLVLVPVVAHLSHKKYYASVIKQNLFHNQIKQYL